MNEKINYKNKVLYNLWTDNYLVKCQNTFSSLLLPIDSLTVFG